MICCSIADDDDGVNDDDDVIKQLCYQLKPSISVGMS